MQNGINARGQSAPDAVAARFAAMAWSDGMLADGLKSNRKGALSSVCSEIGLSVDAAAKLRGELGESPVGDVPFAGTTFIMATTEAACATDSCGTFYSLTTECGCSDTTTGECACFTIWGTMCWTCS